MKSNRLICALNDNGVLNAITLYSMSKMPKLGAILSVPEPNGDHGWFMQLHDFILDTKFKLTDTVNVDIEQIESKFHKQWMDDPHSFDKRNYWRSIRPLIVPATARQNSIDREISEMTGISSSTEYVSIISYLTDRNIIPNKFTSFDDFSKENSFDALSYMVQSTSHDVNGNINISWSMCVYDVSTCAVTMTADPLEFLKLVDGKKIGYCGELYINDCERLKQSKCSTIVWDKIQHSISLMTKPTNTTNFNSLFL